MGFQDFHPTIPTNLLIRTFRYIRMIVWRFLKGDKCDSDDDGCRADDDGRRAKDDGRRAEDDGRCAWNDGRRARYTRHNDLGLE